MKGSVVLLLVLVLGCSEDLVVDEPSIEPVTNDQVVDPLVSEPEPVEPVPEREPLPKSATALPDTTGMPFEKCMGAWSGAGLIADKQDLEWDELSYESGVIQVQVEADTLGDGEYFLRRSSLQWTGDSYFETVPGGRGTAVMYAVVKKGEEFNWICRLQNDNKVREIGLQIIRG